MTVYVELPGGQGFVGTIFYPPDFIHYSRICLYFRNCSFILVVKRPRNLTAGFLASFLQWAYHVAWCAHR